MNTQAFIPLLLFATSANAEMPRYDVVRYCDEIARIGGDFSETLNDSCFDMEQAAYDGLKSGWEALPNRMRAYCDEIARIGGGGSYSLLQSCIQMETSAASTEKTFKY